jgi:hypothetical protein
MPVSRSLISIQHYTETLNLAVVSHTLTKSMALVVNNLAAYWLQAQYIAI